MYFPAKLVIILLRSKKKVINFVDVLIMRMNSIGYQRKGNTCQDAALSYYLESVCATRCLEPSLL